MVDQKVSQILAYIYQSLLSRYGEQYWWPAETPFEVMVGAILTQSCAWRNAEKAIANLKNASLLLASSLRRIPTEELAFLIRPCGFYNSKALKLKSLAQWLESYCDDDLGKLSDVDTTHLRDELLSIQGIGEETADSILLYGVGKPVFVVDAYTRRILSRIGLSPEDGSYVSTQALFMDNLPQSAALFNEYHALLVCLGKDVCRKEPLCQKCPLTALCRYGKEKNGNL